MIESELTIINKLGLHARAASSFVNCANRFSCSVKVANGGSFVDGKSIMSVMMLAAGKGSVLSLRLDGDDEQAALEALRELVDDYFGEGG